MRDKRSSCMWDPHWGNRRLLYDCVWIVSDNQSWANPASTLDESPGGSKFALRNSSLELHLSLLICALGAGLQLVASHESTSPSATQVLTLPVVAARNLQSFANLTTLLCPLLASAAEWHCLKIVIWLILPVVICLSQRLSHACLSINVIQWNCEWLIKTVIVYLIIEFTWITVVILELIHAG